MQTQISGQIIAGLDAYRAARDKLAERAFFGFYGSPFVQSLLGISDASDVRPLPASSPEKRAARQAQSDAYAAMLLTGGFDEALTRAVLYVAAADHMFDQRCALALNAARQHLMRLSLAAFKVMVRDQFFVLQLEHERAVDALATLVPEADARKELLQHVQAIRRRGRSPDRTPSANAWPGCRRCWPCRLKSGSPWWRPTEAPPRRRPCGTRRCGAELAFVRSRRSGGPPHEPVANPLHWTREHQIAWAVVCAFGAIAGLLLGFIHSRIFLTSQPSHEFMVWL